VEIINRMEEGKKGAGGLVKKKTFRGYEIRKRKTTSLSLEASPKEKSTHLLKREGQRPRNWYGSQKKEEKKKNPIYSPSCKGRLEKRVHRWH